MEVGPLEIARVNPPMLLSDPHWDPFSYEASAFERPPTRQPKAVTPTRLFSALRALLARPSVIVSPVFLFLR
ncbi:hypothetical protein OPV22_004737 [Ensete ventricosum]|uniref:Uncharacterized protein n=1 Tax=Ensete ventricosum TaxID=4639 RepID=A0AAV8RN12_ENSVE|nr:hypothetical protein OPV22_004737 [Ensete ventricosum]